MGGHKKFILCEFERGTGAREIYPSPDQMNKVRSKNSKRFSGRNRKFKRYFRPKTGDLKKKKRSSSQKRLKIWCQSTKNPSLDLDLRSRSPEPVNFFGAQSSLGGGTIFVWGGTAPVCPPRGAGSVASSLKDVKELCDKYQIVFLQESWPVKQNLRTLNHISDNHLACGTFKIDFEEELIKKRPSGETAIFWHKDLHATVVKNCDNTIIGLKLTEDNTFLCLVNAN